MKHLVYLLLCLLLCAGVLLLPASAEVLPDDTAAAQAAPAAEEAPAATSRLKDPDSMSLEEINTWYPTLQGRYFRWKPTGVNRFGERSRYNKKYRRFYAIDPAVTIVNHMVFCKVEATNWRGAYYALIDYFDTDEAESAARTLRIPSKLNGLPVDLYLYGENEWTAGLYYCGYSNNTVTKIILDDGFTGVPMFAFENFTALKTVKIPSAATTVGISAFQGCEKLKKIVGGESITAVYSSAFAGCKKLSSFPNMEKLTVIEGSAFSGCAFKTLTLSGNVSLSSGDEDHYSAMSAFGANKKLKSVLFLDGSKKKPLWIGDSTFAGCTALEHVTFTKKCSRISIWDNAFKNCTALQSLHAVDKIKTLGRFCFENCVSLEKLILPVGIQTVSEDAFKGCKNLKKLQLLSSDIDLLGRTFSSGTWYQNDPSDEVTTNFTKFLPKSCTVLVVNKAMKDAVKAHGCKGTVKIRVSVGTPQAFTSRVNRNGTVTFLWDPVKKASGYRLYIFDAATDRWVALKTTTKTSVTIKPTELRAGYVVRAYRVIDGDKSWSGYSDYAKVLLA